MALGDMTTESSQRILGLGLLATGLVAALWEVFESACASASFFLSRAALSLKRRVVVVAADWPNDFSGSLVG